MLIKTIAIGTSTCLALAGLVAIVIAPSSPNASAEGDAPLETNGLNLTGFPAGVVIADSNVCLVQISHASLDHSPVCVVTQGDGSQGVVQPHGEACPCPDDKGRNGKHDHHHHRHHHKHRDGSKEKETKQTIVYKNTTTHTETHRGDTCRDNDETTCNFEEESVEQDCTQSNGAGVVNANVCNVNTQVADDVIVNDAVDVVDESAVAAVVDPIVAIGSNVEDGDSSAGAIVGGLA